MASSNFPGSLDDSTTVGSDAVPAAGDDLNDTIPHSDRHQYLADAVVQVETKVGTGASAPTADKALLGDGTGTSAWTAVTVSGDATGTLASGDIPLTIAADAVDETMVATGAWTTYTPTWTGATSDPAIGNGTLGGAFLEMGSLLFLRIHVIMGSTTTYGAGQWFLSLPSGKTAASQYQVLSAVGRDAGTTLQPFAARMATTTAVKIVTDDNFVHDTNPWTWADGDSLYITGVIEIDIT